MMAFSTETSRIEKKSRHLLPRQVAINDSANGEKQAKQQCAQHRQPQELTSGAF